MSVTLKSVGAPAPARAGLHWEIDAIVAELRAVRVKSLESRQRAADHPPRLPTRKALLGILDGLTATLFPNRLGAPDLTDAIWLYGGSRADITQTITNSRFGVMPAWGKKLDAGTIKMLAAYVHSLGGGEDFVEAAAQPAAEVNEQP